MCIVRLLSAIVQAAIASCVLSAVPVLAQDPPPPIPEVQVGVPALLLAAAGVGLDAHQRVPYRQLFPLHDRKPRRPAALLPLYGSLITLQGLDVHSTRRALDAGAGESNPAMRPVVTNGAAFLAVKAGATASVIWVSERMWKKNRKAALILTGVVNVAMAAVVANNYRVSRRGTGRAGR
jgi:hypothetical protein